MSSYLPFDDYDDSIKKSVFKGISSNWFSKAAPLERFRNFQKSYSDGVHF